MKYLLSKALIWQQDQSGLVLVFSALVLPVILLIGLLVLQGGQLYVRQSELQFVARQAANSSLMVIAEKLKKEAEENYDSMCQVEFPPGICSSKDWADFLTPAQSRSIALQSQNFEAVVNEAQSFAEQTDPGATLLPDAVTVVFPYDSGNEQELVVQVLITEPQTYWISSLLQSNSYALKVEARSYLSLL